MKEPQVNIVDIRTKQKRYSDRHHELGLCAFCNTIATNGKRCKHHYDLHLSYSKKLYDRMKRDNKICPKCFNVLNEDVDKNYILCSNCRQHIRVSFETLKIKENTYSTIYKDITI